MLNQVAAGGEGAPDFLLGSPGSNWRISAGR